jgi:molybdopterin converting factor small subunit
MPVVRIPTPLRVHSDGQESVEVQGDSVRAALGDLTTLFPGLLERLFEGPELRRFVNVYVNNEDIRYLDDLDTPVAAGDEISIIPAIAGG